jgi:hypothetical protein
MKFWKELIAYFPLTRHGSHRKRCVQYFIVSAGTSILSYCLVTLGGYIGRTTDTRVQKLSLAPELVYRAVVYQRYTYTKIDGKDL